MQYQKRRHDRCRKPAVVGPSLGLRRAEPALRVALVVNPPAPTGDRRFDAYLAAVVEYRLAREGLPIPSWVDEDWRFLNDPWDIEQVASLQAAARDVTPAEFRRHGVYLDPINLANI